MVSLDLDQISPIDFGLASLADFSAGHAFKTDNFQGGNVMRAILSLRTLMGGIKDRLAAAARKREILYCSECERSERCGLPPSDDCVYKLEQLERNRGRPPKRAAWYRERASLGA